jgi:hypothetical protein
MEVRTHKSLLRSSRRCAAPAGYMLYLWGRGVLMNP